MVGVFLPEGFEGDLVVVGFCDLVGPSFELGASPLEAMVAVTELAGLHPFEEDVVFDVGRGDDDVGWAGALENDTREGFESGRIEVLDDFDERGDVVINQTGVTIDQGALQESEAFIVLATRAGDEAFPCDFERAGIDVHPGDFWNGGVFEKAVEEFSFPTTKVEDGGGSEGLDDFSDTVETEGMKGDLLFDFGLFFEFGVFRFGRELGEGLTGEATLKFEVAGDDPISLGMILEPVFSFAQELFDFLFSDPVMFLAIEDGNEDEEVLEKGLESAGFTEGDVVIIAFAPVGEVGIERGGLAGDLVSERREESLKLGLAARCGKGWKAGGEIEFLVDEFRTFLTGAVEGGSENPGNGGREEGGSNERSVVDVLSESPVCLPCAFGADEIDGVDFHQEDSGAFSIRGIRVKDGGFSKGERAVVYVRGIFVKKKAEVGGVWAAVGEGEEHGGSRKLPLSDLGCGFPKAGAFGYVRLWSRFSRMNL